jgi:hypothetical protein
MKSKRKDFSGKKSVLGMPLRKAAGYEAAQSGRRLGNWQPGSDSANTLLFRDADLMRSRARDLVRRNAWAFNAVDALVSNLVGTGIKPRSIGTEPDFNEQAHARGKSGCARRMRTEFWVSTACRLWLCAP